MRLAQHFTTAVFLLGAALFLPLWTVKKRRGRSPWRPNAREGRAG